MAKFKNNPLIHNVRGNLGKQYVYKKRGSNQHLALMPEINEKAVVTAQQKKIRTKFSSASRFAAHAMINEDLRKGYEKKATKDSTAFNIAFRDYLKAPVVDVINTRKYDGTPGSTISIEAIDDFRVTEVLVTILSPDGTLLEKGNAVIDLITLKWNYTATKANASLAGTIISVTALDVPQNEGSLEVTL